MNDSVADLFQLEREGLFRDMAAVAGFEGHTPCDLAIVTGAAEFTLLDRIHGDLICSGLHIKQCRVTRVTFVADAMDPMGEDRDRDPSLPTFPLEDHISLNRKGHAEEKYC